LEHPQDFIYYAYTFYTGLLEEPTLNPFKSGWLEALGDLAWYRMAVAAIVNGDANEQGSLTIKAVSEVTGESSDTKDSSEKQEDASGSAKSISDAPAARIDDSPSPSIGVAAARLLEVEPEKERWRNIASAAGIAEQPGTGKLHHHLGLLSSEVEGEELRGVYHFVKRYFFGIGLLFDHR
jgi:protein SMG6